MTFDQLLKEGTEALQRADDPDAGLDAKQLLMAAFDVDVVHFLLNRMQPLPEAEATTEKIQIYQDMIKKRSQRIPQQQILGSQEFMGLNFVVNRHVLIPRQDTETLVELILTEQRSPDLSLLDLGTGSGCIAICLAALGRYQKITAVDISTEALTVARHNGKRLLSDYDGQIRFWHSDLFTAFQDDSGAVTEKFDIIVSNPPYIPTAVIETLQPEVREHEPYGALDGAADGLLYYRRIASEAKWYAKPDAVLYLEIGHDQGIAVSELLAGHDYTNVEVFKDLTGNDRVVRACLPGD